VFLLFFLSTPIFLGGRSRSTVWCGAKTWGVQHTHQQPLGGCGNTWIRKSQLDSLWFRSSFRAPKVLKVYTGSSGAPYRNFWSRPPELPVWYLTFANSSLWVSGFAKRPFHPPLGQLRPFKNYAPNVEHDLEDPPMVVGSTYANMYTFKLASFQHAIKNQFVFNTAKSAPNMFRAYCSGRDKDNCSWWIFDSTTKDNCTVVVRLCLCPYVNWFYPTSLRNWMSRIEK
jgi:hypothetical protein